MLEWEIKPYVFLFQYDADKKEDHFKLIEEFCGQHTTIAPMIAKASAKFNPIRDYYSLASNLVDLGLVLRIRTSLSGLRSMKLMFQ